MIIISLHLPKTGGTSFKASLMTHFGDRYRNDYGDHPISQSRSERLTAAFQAGVAIAEEGLVGVECVHGHFLPMKYLGLATQRELAFVTWMREPVARLLSHYYYWQQSYDQRTASSHHRQVIEEGWTLEQFCLSEQFRNIYSQYLSGLPLANFAFVGISEHYREDMHEFTERFLSTQLEPRYLNATNYRMERTRVSEAFLDEVRDFHAVDVDLYQWAVQARAARFRDQLSETVT